jgi:hypothetical protein
MMDWPADWPVLIRSGVDMSDLNRRRWHGAVWLAALLALTLAVRVGVLVAMQDNLRQDPDAYRITCGRTPMHIGTLPRT